MRKIILFSVTCITLIVLAAGTYSASTELANGIPPPLCDCAPISDAA